jgi:hypothetical protein
MFMTILDTHILLHAKSSLTDLQIWQKEKINNWKTFLYINMHTNIAVLYSMDLWRKMEKRIWVTFHNASLCETFWNKGWYIAQHCNRYIDRMCLLSALPVRYFSLSEHTMHLLWAFFFPTDRVTLSGRCFLLRWAIFEEPRLSSPA